MAKVKVSVSKKGDTSSYKKSVGISKNAKALAKKKERLGNLYLSSSQLPEIKNWEVGGEYQVLATVRQTSMREPDRWELEEGKCSPDDVKADFDILSIEPYNDMGNDGGVSKASNGMKYSKGTKGIKTGESKKTDSSPRIKLKPKAKM